MNISQLKSKNMVVKAKNKKIKQRFVNRKRVRFVLSIGLVLLSIPIVFIFYNPILMLANYQLRLANGTLLHELLKQEIEGAKLFIYLFNITNSEQFLSGEEDKIKLDEIGPFVYQEYRTNDDLELNVEPGIMRYSPNHRIEFIAEESFGRPEDVQFILPNIALLSSIQMLSKYPQFMGHLFRIMISGMKLKPMQSTSAHNYLWGNTDPLIKMVNSLVPGLIYFQSTGVMTRLYDPDAKYRLELGTSEKDKFQVRKVRRYQANKKIEGATMLETTYTYNNTYEGAAFPPLMSPNTPLKIYRYSICKTLNMGYVGTRVMDYGSEAFVYSFDNSTFNDHMLCDSKGWCPSGILDLSPCYYGFPFAISKGHLLDTEPKIYDKLEGLKPNRSIHDTTLLIDPKIGVTVGARMSAQLNLALGDMSLLTETRRLSDMFLPVTHAIIKHPRMREETKYSLRLLYTYGPYILFSGQILCALLGCSFLVFAARMHYTRKRGFERQVLCNKVSVMSQAPLLD